jgi:hypothetical protein
MSADLDQPDSAIQGAMPNPREQSGQADNVEPNILQRQTLPTSQLPEKLQHAWHISAQKDPANGHSPP